MTRTQAHWGLLSLRRALVLGLLTGLGEAVIRFGWRYFGRQMLIHGNVDLLWMAPLANAGVFLVIALGVVAVLSVAGGRISTTYKLAIVTGVLAALAAWSLTERVPQIGRRPGAILGAGVGVFVAQALARRRDGTHRSVLDAALMPVAGLVALAGVAVLAPAQLRERRALGALLERSADAPNVLLLILDTVRAQSTSLYGYARRTTPVLSALADSGVRFDHAYATAPWTLPSHASMFTGRYPHELSADWLTPLDGADKTLAERFRDAGYATAGFVGNYMTSHETGLARGFMHYEDYQRTIGQFAMHSAFARWLLHWPRLRRMIGWYEHVNRRTADDVTAGVVKWVRRRGDRPFFAFVNYYDAHEFYLPPAPFATMFGPDTARKNGNIGFSMPNGGIAFRTNKQQMQPHEVQGELDAYESALAYVDARIGTLLDSLAASGALSNTIIVVSSDHGEHFGEHGEFDHGATLYPQVLHVPLLIKAPGRAPVGIRVRERVTLRDLAATIEELAFGSSSLPGSSLSAYWDADSATSSSSPILATRTIASRRPIPDSARHGAWGTVIADKLLIEFVGGRDVRTESYDLIADPLALNPADVSSVQPAIDSARALYRGLRWRSREPRSATPR